MTRWVPTFIYGPVDALVTLAFSLPVGVWLHSSRSGGVIRWTATGVPGPTVQLRKQCLTVPLRFTEAEWPAVRALIEWGQTKAPFTWYPESSSLDQDQMVSTQVVLEAPKVGDPIMPQPDSNYPRMLSLSVTFRQIEVGNDS